MIRVFQNKNKFHGILRTLSFVSARNQWKCLSRMWNHSMKMISRRKNVSLIVLPFTFVWVDNNKWVWFNDFFSYSDVKELVQDCVGGAALQQCKAKIQAYSDQTSSTLKKHVYANYMQFIETAKEISRMIQMNVLKFLFLLLRKLLFFLQIWNQKCTNCRIFWSSNVTFYQRCVMKIQRMTRRA